MPEDLQQTIAPLIRSIDKMEVAIQRVAERLDMLPSVYMARTEYEARHTDLAGQVHGLRIKLDEEKRLADAEHKRIEDAFRKEVDALQMSIDTKQQTSLGHRLTLWIAAGGWIVAIVGIIVGHYWH